MAERPLGPIRHQPDCDRYLCIFPNLSPVVLSRDLLAQFIVFFSPLTYQSRQWPAAVKAGGKQDAVYLCNNRQKHCYKINKDMSLHFHNNSCSDIVSWQTASLRIINCTKHLFCSTNIWVLEESSQGTTQTNWKIIQLRYSKDPSHFV